MNWSTQSRQVAEPTGAEVSGISIPGGVMIRLDVTFRTVEWPWEENGPVSLIPQPGPTTARVKKGEFELGFAFPDPRVVLLPPSHSSTASIQFTLVLSHPALRALETARDEGKLELDLMLAAHPLSIYQQAEHAHGIDVRPTSQSYRFQVPLEQWKEILESARYNEELSFQQTFETQLHALVNDLEDRRQKADALLETIREGAIELSVSQQAMYFKEEAEAHATEATKWLKRSRNLTIGLAVYACATLFLHKVPLLEPESTAEAVQFGIGKMLVFATIAYFLILSARNYMAHRHNAIVNKHRQNSLVTYRALVEAAGDQANRDIILAKAAESIFGAQATGFTKHDGDEGKAISLVSVGANAFKSGGGGT